MTLVSDQPSHQAWTSQVVRVLDGEFGADSCIAPPSDKAMGQGFAPVGHWFADALVPLICSNATLRGETQVAALASDTIPRKGLDPDLVAQLVTAQLRYSFGFDAYFDVMHQSALDYSADNPEMIAEHFGTAETYAEHYAQSSCEFMQQIAARGVDRVICRQMTRAFRDADVAAWAACFPGSFTRGVLTSYALAQGPIAISELANGLKRRLGEAFATYDKTDKTGGNNGSKQP